MSHPTPPLAARLDHIALGSPDPKELAGFHARVMGLDIEVDSGGLFGVARDRRLHFVDGPAKSLAFAGYAIQDEESLPALVERLQSVNWPYEVKAEGTGQFEPGAIALSDPDGNNFIFGHAAAREACAADVLAARLQHLVVGSTDAGRISRFFQEVVGFVLSDNVYDAERKLRTSFLRCSEEHHSFAVFQAPAKRFDHHCYEVGEWNLIRDWGDHLAACDVPVKWGPGRHGPGNNLFLLFRDLDGNALELSAELELVEPDRPAGEWLHVEKTRDLWGGPPPVP